MYGTLKPDTDISNAGEGNQKGSKGCGEGEDLPVSLEELIVVWQACEDRLHTAHLVDTNRKTWDSEMSTPKPKWVVLLAQPKCGRYRSFLHGV